MSLTYFLLLPSTSAMSSPSFDAYDFIPSLSDDEDELSDADDESVGLQAGRGLARTQSAIASGGLTKAPHLSTKEKMALAKPLVLRYMLPLFFGELFAVVTRQRFWLTIALPRRSVSRW